MPSCSLCSLQVEPIFIWHDYICIYGASFSLFAFVTKWFYGLARLYNFNDIAIQCHTNWDTLIRMQTVHLITQKCFMPGSTKTRMMHFYRSSGSKKLTWSHGKEKKFHQRESNPGRLVPQQEMLGALLIAPQLHTLQALQMSLLYVWLSSHSCTCLVGSCQRVGVVKWVNAPVQCVFSR